jgi:hypothetical protein
MIVPVGRIAAGGRSSTAYPVRSGLTTPARWVADLGSSLVPLFFQNSVREPNKTAAAYVFAAQRHRLAANHRF